MRAVRILRISRVVSDLARAEAFYRDALGFRRVGGGRTDRRVLSALGLAGTRAEEVTLRLGADTLTLVQFATPGRAYPPDSRSDDLWFQHVAIVVRDIDAAYAHLMQHAGWRPISHDGPQSLPPSSGGVRAFKFRDPDSHPLELIWFPPGQGRAVWHGNHGATLFLGIDHSAVAISSSWRNVRFYRALGLRISARSFNDGAAQSRLDGLRAARLRVTALRPQMDQGPGLELLGYEPAGRPDRRRVANDLATDWVTLGAAHRPRGSPLGMRDPDGHRLVLVAQGPASTEAPALGPTT